MSRRGISSLSLGFGYCCGNRSMLSRLGLIRSQSRNSQPITKQTEPRQHGAVPVMLTKSLRQSTLAVILALAAAHSLNALTDQQKKWALATTAIRTSEN